MTINAFIFDIDGTLMDTNGLHAQAWARAFRAYGKRVSLKRLRAQMGKGADQLLPEFLTPGEIKRIGEAMAELQENIFALEFWRKVRPFPQVRRLFKKIKKKGIQIALASSGKKEQVEKHKKIAGITRLVDHATSSDDAVRTKPEPDIFHAAMKKLGHPPKAGVVVVGDSPHDALAARKAKLPFIGLLCGGFPRNALKKHGCLAIYRDPADLLKHLEGLLAD